MPRPSPVRYATSDGLSIAYQVIGDGPIDVVSVPGSLNNLEGAAEEPALDRLYERMAEYSRVITLDPRGLGLSDRLPPDRLPTLEERSDDVLAVMDAAGSEVASLLGVADGGPVSVFVAARRPERIRSLVLKDTSARAAWAPDHPWGFRQADLEQFLVSAERLWGRGLFARLLGLDDDEAREAYGRLERRIGTPSTGAAVLRSMIETDVTALLPLVTVPTLVVQNPSAPIWPLAGAEHLRDHIAGARLVTARVSTLPYLPSPDLDALGDQLEEFYTGVAPTARLDDRVLKTVLFTDIVGSTSRAVALGDERWTSLLDAHDQTVRTEVGAFGGEVVNTTGDGFLVAFDGPTRAVHAALSIVSATALLGVDVRAGLHTGECERRGSDLAGVAVHLAARVAARADGSQVLVTRTVRDLVAGADLSFRSTGTHELKGLPEESELFIAARSRTAG